MNKQLAVSTSLSSPSTTARLAQVRSIKWLILRRDRSLPHFGRKGYHFAMGLFCIALYAFVLDRAQALLVLGGVGGLWIGCDVLRLRFSKLNAATMRIFGKIMRREELKGISANSYYILGMFVVVLFFSKPIVLLSVLFLALGDPVAAIFGTLFGRHLLVGKKSLEGALANLALSTVATFFMSMGYFQLSLERSIALSLVGGMVSMLSELSPLPVNDNLSIPVLSALMLSAINTVCPLI